jgi:hypothetical protein
MIPVGSLDLKVEHLQDVSLKKKVNQLWSEGGEVIVTSISYTTTCVASVIVTKFNLRQHTTNITNIIVHVDIYWIVAVIKVKTDIITSIIASLDRASTDTSDNVCRDMSERCVNYQ